MGRSSEINRPLRHHIFRTRGGNVVEGCYVGVDPSGSDGAGNRITGIVLDESPDARIGGTTPEGANVISANGGSAHAGGGISLYRSPGATIRGNFIGTDATARVALGNAGAGIRCEQSDPLVIGGTEEGAGNVIAHNLGPGVHARFGFGISVLSNAIYGNGNNVGNNNGHYGIHYEYIAGIEQPTLTFVGAEAGGTRVEGALHAGSGRAGLRVRIELFRNPGCDETGIGQGTELAGALEAIADEAGLVTFSHLVPVALSRGEAISATATDLTRASTSFFSNCLPDTNGCRRPFVTTPPTDLSLRAGETATLSVAVAGDGPVAYRWSGNAPGMDPFEPIPGAASSTYTTPPLAGFAVFTATATNACGEDSRSFGINVCSEAPAISRQPEGGTVVAGSTRLLAVELAGSGYDTFQWYEGARGDTSTPLAGGGASFRPPPPARTTSYWVRVTNGCGSVDSQAATISVVPPIEITKVKIARKGSGELQLVAKGRNLGTRVWVSVDGVAFASQAAVKGKTIRQTGALADGRGIDDVIRPGATVRLRFVSSDRGTVEVDYTRP